MKINFIIIGLITLLFIGCVNSGMFPNTTGTTVDLSKKNYRIVKLNAIGQSRGFKLLGIIPIVSPRYTKAMKDLYSKADISEGKARALINIAQERSSTYLILFSITKLTIKADIIEFLDNTRE